jgi:hypothetical protein
VDLDVHLLVVLFMARVACDTCIYEPIFLYAFNNYVEALNR